MATIGCSMRGALALAALAVLAAVPPRAASANDGKDVPLAAHRAIYDLKLADARGKRSLEAVRGRIVYDFSGSTCEGYALQFRQVTELDSGEGKVAVSDLRTATWEGREAADYRINSQKFLNRQLVDSVDGRAARRSDGVAVSLAKPQDKKLDIGTVVFPTEHMRKIIAAARAGQTLLELAVYDGSDTGEKIYQSLTVI